MRRTGGIVILVLAAGCPAGRMQSSADSSPGSGDDEADARWSMSEDSGSPDTGAVRPDATTAPPDAAVAAEVPSDDAISHDSGDSGAASDGQRAADAPPPPVIECKVARYCDDFEAYKTDGAPAGWTAHKGGGGTIAVDGTRSYSGTRAIHITVPGGGAQAQISRKMPALPVPDNNVYGRMMIYLPRPVPSGVHFDVMAASGTTSGGVQASYQLGANGNFLPTYYPGSCYAGTGTRPPTGRWFCLRWQFDGSADGKGGTRDVSRAWLDGATKPFVTVDRFLGVCERGGNHEWVAPNFTTLTIGWVNYQKLNVPVEMWLDDIAIDNKPLGCPAP